MIKTGIQLYDRTMSLQMLNDFGAKGCASYHHVVD